MVRSKVSIRVRWPYGLTVHADQVPCVHGLLQKSPRYNIPPISIKQLEEQGKMFEEL